MNYSPQAENFLRGGRMCGVAGLVSRDDVSHKKHSIHRMTERLQHRGPDGTGTYVDESIALGHTRLSIVDVAHGAQPMHLFSDEGHYSIVFNGEIFNHKVLRKTLEHSGYKFKTHCDTEVLLSLFALYGPSAIERLNGQWALAIWDHNRKRLFLSRDRTGVRPLHYVSRDGDFAFASEVKSLFTLDWVERALDPEALDDILHFWAPLPGKTVFKGVKELPPGHSMFVTQDGKVDIFSYWDISYPKEKDDYRTADIAVDALSDRLLEAIRLRLDADVPVGAYLSGGLDSSIVVSLAKSLIGENLQTFGISFSDPRFDESTHQAAVTQALGTKHHSLYCSPAEIGAAFTAAVCHAERPLVRTAPVPMYLLSRLVKERGFKVVLTGEGADEFFGGYDLFRETLVRRYTMRRPLASSTNSIYRRLYSYIPELQSLPTGFLDGFFGQTGIGLESPLFSHIPRIETTRRIRGLLHPDWRLEEYGACQRLIRMLPYSFYRMSPLEKSQYLEAKVLMPGYILSSQGDRMSMAHGVEGRFPFLDPNVIRFATRLPSYFRVLGFKEKWLLKRLGGRLLPESIWGRHKQPFRAPDAEILQQGKSQNGESLLSFLSPERVRNAGIFSPVAVEKLRKRSQESQRPLSIRDQMALTFALSTQILHESYITR